MRFVLLPICVCCVSLCIASCALPDHSSTSSQPRLSEAGDTPIDAFRVAYDNDGVTVYSGGEPTADGALEHLASLGVTTVVSVDASKPDADAIESLGMRSVHVPIGYAAVPVECQASVARAIRESDGAVFIHCHHGLHRGPTATAAGLVALGYMTPSAGLAFMKQAGTSESYEGLYRSVEQAVEIEEEAISGAELVRIAEVRELAAQMAEIDRVFEHLEQLASNNWEAPDDHPDLSARSEAGQISDLFRAVFLEQVVGSKRPTSAADRSLDQLRHEIDRIEAYANASQTAGELESAIVEGMSDRAHIKLEALHDQCVSCHGKYR